MESRALQPYSPDDAPRVLVRALPTDDLRQCQNCWTMASPPEFVLRTCSGCKLFVYCNSECQRVHWPDHKGFCRAEQQFRKDIKEMDGTEANSSAGITTRALTHKEMAYRYKKWRHRHLMIFHWAVCQALTLGSTPERLLTHGVVFNVRPTRRGIDKSEPFDRDFEVASSNVVPISALYPFFPNDITYILGAKTREVHQVGGLGCAVVIIVLQETEFLELCMPILWPMAFMFGPWDLEPEHEDWREMVNGFLEKGWRFYTTPMKAIRPNSMLPAPV